MGTGCRAEINTLISLNSISRYPVLEQYKEHWTIGKYPGLQLEGLGTQGVFGLGVRRAGDFSFLCLPVPQKYVE